MIFHASRKTILEIEFEGEEGTGLGPTLEFYALVAAELQKKSLGLWLCDDDDLNEKSLEQEMDLGEGMKPAGFYIRRPGGLFPAPLPQNSAKAQQAEAMFWFIGVFLAKVLQDSRLINLPLSRPFLKLLCSKFKAPLARPRSPAESSGGDWVVSEARSLDSAWRQRIFDWNDFDILFPVKARFLRQLRSLVKQKQNLEKNDSLTEAERRMRISRLELDVDGHRCKLDELALTFSLNPPSQVTILECTIEDFALVITDAFCYLFACRCMLLEYIC